MPDYPSSTVDGVEYAWGLATLFPPQGAWSEEEYLSLTDSRRGIEFVDGRLEFLPVPTDIHHTLLQFLFVSLRDFVIAGQLGKVHFAGLRVRTLIDKIREPDIVFFAQGQFCQAKQSILGGREPCD